MRLNSIKSKKQERMKKVAISSIVTIILLVLVSTVIVGFILAWSKNEVKTSLDVSKENLKQLSEFECKNVKYTVESCKLDKVNNNIEIVFTNSSQVNLFNIVLSITGRNELGEQMNYIGSFNDVIKKGESRTLSTSADNFDVIRQGDTFPNLNVTTLDSIMLTNGACPNKPINLSNCDLSLLVVSTPTFSVPAGTYSTSQSITLSTEAGATIHYTIDGTTPTSNSTVYLVPLVIPLDTNRTIKAMATRPGYTDSSVSSASYVITHQLSTPEPSVTPGMYSPEQTLTLSGEAGSTYYYTLDGSTPTTGSTLYSGSITITYGYTTLKVLATKDTYGDSNIYTGNYYVYRPGRYWIGGSGSWSDTNHWSTFPGGTSGASVPTLSNDVFFDENSFSANGGIVTLDVNVSVKDINFSGLDQNITLTSSVNSLYVYGSLLLSTKLATSFTNIASLYFKSTTTGKTITSNGNTSGWNFIYFNGVGGSWTLMDNFSSYSTTFVYLQNGTLDLNDFNVLVYRLQLLGGTFNAGSGIITISRSLVINGGINNFETSTLNFNGIQGIYGQSVDVNYYNVTFRSSSTLWINNSTYLSSFNNLTIDSPLFYLTGNITVSNTLTVEKIVSTQRVLIYSDTIGTPRKITAANVVASNVDFRDINFANSINLADINGYSGDAGGNYGITFTSAQLQYFKHTSGAVNWSDSTKWFSDYNRTVAGRVPLPQDDATFDANSFTGTSTLTVNVPRIGRSLDMSAVDDAVTMSLANDIQTYGSFILGNNITPSGSYSINLFGRNNFDFNSAGKTIYYVNLYMYTGVYTNKSNIVTSSGMRSYSGTFDFNDYNLSTDGLINFGHGTAVYLGNGTFTSNRSTTAGSCFTFGTSINVYSEDSTLILASTGTGDANVLFQGGGKVFNKVYFSGTHNGSYNIEGSNTFSEIRIDPGRKVRFTAGTTQTITGDLNATGTDVNNRITLTSTVAGSYWKISKASGISSNDYLDISDSNATGGATWYAGANSLDTNHNTGWIFTAIPGRYWVGGTGNWSDTNHWAVSPGGAGGATVPTSSDDVFFTAASFSVDASVVTIDTNAYTKNIDFTNIDQTATLSSSTNAFYVYGSITLSNKLTWSFTSTAYTYFKATSSVTMKMNGSIPHFNRLYMDGVGGKWTLQDNMNCGVINPWNFVNGEFDTNNKNVTKYTGGDLSWQLGTGTKKLTLGSSIITLGNGVSFGTVNDGGLTLDAGTSTIIIQGDWFTGATKTFYNVEINTTSRLIGGSIGAFTCNNLSRTSGANTLGNMPISTDINVTGTLTLTGYNDSNYRLIMASNTTGTRKITAANVVASNVDFRDINFANPINLADINGYSGDAGGNYGITFTSAQPQYFKHTSGAVNWSDATKWFSDYNRTIPGRVPLPQDDATFDANSFTGTSTLTVNVPRIGRSLDMSAVDDNVSFVASAAIESYGNFILGSNITPTTTTKTFLGIGDYNINTFGKITQSYIYIYRGNYTVLSNIDLGSAASNQLVVYSGGLNLNGFNFNGILFQIYAGATCNLGSGTITLTGNSSWSSKFALSGTCTGNSATVIMLNNFTATNDDVPLTLGSNTIGTIILQGSTTRYHNFSGSATIENLVIYPGKKVRFTAGTTTTITGDLNATGTDVNNRITLASTVAGSYWKISKASGISSNDYLDISDSNATGGATWYAGANSLDTNHNTGWIFTAIPGRYWVGGSGSWSDTNHWAVSPGGAGGASVPTSSDDVFFTAASFNVDGNIVTLDVNASAQSIDFSGLDQNITLTSTINSLSVYGSLTLSTKLATSFTGIAYLYLKSTTTCDIRSNGWGGNWNKLYIDGSNGIFTLQDNAMWTYNGTIIYLLNGTFNLNDKNLQVNELYTDTGTKTLLLTSSTLTIRGYHGGQNTTGLTFDAGTSLVKSTDVLNRGAYFNQTMYDVEFPITTDTTSAGLQSCRNLTIVPSTGRQYSLTNDLNITGTLTLTGYSDSNNRLFIVSNTIGTVRKITAANVVASNVDFRDVNGAGAFNWDLTGVTGNSGNAGGNTGILFSTATPQYFKHTSGVVSWSDSTKWFSDYNRTILGRVPLPQDDVFFDANSFTGTSTLTVNSPRIGKSIDMSEVDDAVAMNLSTDPQNYGSLILGENITPSVGTSKVFYLMGRGDYVIKTYNRPLFGLYFDAPSSNYVALSNITTSASDGIYTTHINSFDLNDFNFTGGRIVISTGTNNFYCGNGLITLTRTSATTIFANYIGAGHFYAENSTIKIEPASGSSNLNFNAEGFTYNNIWFSGMHTGNFNISGSNTINNLQIDSGRKVQFTAGTTQTITGDLNATGTDTNKITLSSITPGSYWKIFKASGISSNDYLDISDSNATGGATWYAGANSLDTNHNTGWIFTAIPGRYWVGGSGSWSDTNHWSVSPGGAGGASVPTLSDDVFFTAASFSVDGNIVTLDVNASAQSIDFSGLDQNITLTSSINSLSVYGSLTLSTKLATSFTNIASLNFKATTSVNINANGNTSRWLQIIFDGVGGTWTLLSDWNIVGINTIYSTNGTLNTNDYNLATTSIVTTSTNAFNYILGSSTLTLNQWYAYYGGTTLDAGTSTFKVASLWLPGDKNYYNVELDNVTQTSSAVSVSRGVYNNLTIKRQFIVGGNQTINGTLTIKNTIDTQRVLIASRDIGIKYIFTTPSALIESTDFKDINGAGAFNWDLSNISGGSGNAGGNSGILFTTAQNNYWVADTGSWSDSTKWKLSDHTSSGRVPLPQDNAYFDANSFTTTTRVVTVDVPRAGKDIDFNAITVGRNPVFSQTMDYEVYGSFVLKPSMTTSYPSLKYGLSLVGRGNHILSLQNIQTTYYLGINSIGGTYTLDSNLNLPGNNFAVNYGTFDAATSSVTVYGFNSSNSNVRSIKMGTGIWTIIATTWDMGTTTNLTFDAGTSTISYTHTSYPVNFYGGGLTYYNFRFLNNGSGLLRFYSTGSFNNFICNYKRTITMQAGSTTTIRGDFNVNGINDTNKVTFVSSTPGSYWNISKASGIVSNDYLDLSDSNATGGATFYAGGNSIDTNHNSGWIFSWPADNLAFDNRKKITISKTNVDSNLVDFPLLVKISGDANIGAVAMEDGNDIRFTDASGNLLYSEKEDFNISDGLATGNFWVKVPSISSITDTNIYVYYGASGASAQTGSTNVWDSNYVMVQNLNNLVIDSTDNNNDGNIIGATLTTDRYSRQNQAYNFDGNDYISLPSITLPINGTISMGINLSQTTVTQYFIGGTNQGIRYHGTKFLVYNGNEGWIALDWTKEDRWINFSVIRINSTDYDIYIDYNKIGTSVAGIPGDDIIIKYLGKRSDGYYFIGPIDYIRISNNTRSDAWIKFEYYNMNSANNELTFGIEE